MTLSTQQRVAAAQHACGTANQLNQMHRKIRCVAAPTRWEQKAAFDVSRIAMGIVMYVALRLDFEIPLFAVHNPCDEHPNDDVPQRPHEHRH